MAQWSSYTNGTSPEVNTTRINVAINWAEAVVNTRGSMSVYQIPFVSPTGTVPYEITQMCAELAGLWLWNSRALKQSESNQKFMVSRKKEVMGMLQAIISGTYPINAVHRGRASQVPFSACLPAAGYGAGWGFR